MKFYDWQLEKNVSEPWVFADNIFTDEECDKILKLFSENDVIDGTTSGYGNDDNIRRSKIIYIESSNPENYWIFQRCTGVIQHLNNQFFQFDLEKMEALQIGRYDSKNQGCFKKHIDAGYESPVFRKLSFSIQLSDDNSYEGGDLLLYGGEEYDTAPRRKGTIIAFPSFALHEVTPVTSGVRYSLVGWVCGPKFR